MRTAAHWARRLRAALTAAPTRAVAGRWLQNRTATSGTTTTARDTAVVWLAATGFTLTRYIEPALTGMYTDGYLIGDRSAAVLLGDRDDPGLVGWAPGDPAASAVMVDTVPGGLRTLLGTTGAVAAGISATYTRKLAGVLADADLGDDPDDVTGLDTELSDLVDDDSVALMIGVTEVSRAVNVAALDRYVAAGNVTEYRWVASGGACSFCLGNAAAGSLLLGQSFPNGDAPAHPNCRCVIVPVL